MTGPGEYPDRSAAFSRRFFFALAPRTGASHRAGFRSKPLKSLACR
jgi:hypothetical protein